MPLLTYICRIHKFVKMGQNICTLVLHNYFYDNSYVICYIVSFDWTILKYLGGNHGVVIWE